MDQINDHYKNEKSVECLFIAMEDGLDFPTEMESHSLIIDYGLPGVPKGRPTFDLM